MGRSEYLIFTLAEYITLCLVLLRFLYTNLCIIIWKVYDENVSRPMCF